MEVVKTSVNELVIAVPVSFIKEESGNIIADIDLPSEFLGLEDKQQVSLLAAVSNAFIQIGDNIESQASRDIDNTIPTGKSHTFFIALKVIKRTDGSLQVEINMQAPDVLVRAGKVEIKNVVKAVCFLIKGAIEAIIKRSENMQTTVGGAQA